MRDSPRPRRYLGRPGLVVLRPLLRRSASRDAYVLRGVGNRFGPVLRQNRRHDQLPIDGAERRRRNRVGSARGAAPSR